MAKSLRFCAQDTAAEILIVSIGCFAPWAYGSVDAWAEFIIYGVLLAIIALRSIADWRVGERSLGSGFTYWALLLLVVLAFLQTVPWSDQTLGFLSPGALKARSDAFSQIPVSVRGDSGAVVKAGRSTISLDPNETWHGIVRLAAIFLLFDCASRSRRGDDAFEWFAKALTVNATFLSIFSLVQALSWNGKIYWTRSTISLTTPWHVGGPFFSHNHLAANLNLSLGPAIGLLLVSLRRSRIGDIERLKQYYWIYAIGLIAAGVLASQSRGAILSMTISLFVILPWIGFKRTRFLAGILAILAISILFLISLGTWSPLQRLGTIPDALTTGLNGRDEVWRSSLATWRSYPILGTGFGTFAEANAPNFNPGIETYYGHFASHAESEYMEMLVEGGLVGLGILLMMLMDMMRHVIIAMKQASMPLRYLILGGLIGITALILQSLADFPLHLAGVTVPAVIVASKLYRLALCQKPSSSLSDPERANPFLLRSRRTALTLKNLALTVTAGALLLYQASEVTLERLVEKAWIPLPGSQWVTADVPRYSQPTLETMRIALIESLKLRPDWAEGHLRLGEVQLGLYRHAAADALGIKLVTVEPKNKEASTALGSKVKASSAPDLKPGVVPLDRTQGATLKNPGGAGSPQQIAGESTTPAATSEPTNTSAEANADISSSPTPDKAEILWLHKMVHGFAESDGDQLDQLLEYEPVRDYLIPAARSFLEARRCCPVLAVPHLQLGCLDYLLLDRHQTGLDYVKRGITLQGNYHQGFLIGAQVAVDLKEFESATQFWRDYLKLNPKDWEFVAIISSPSLTTDQLLEVAKGGGAETLFQFGKLLYSGPIGLFIRVRFMEAALAVLPLDTRLDVAERLWVEGEIRGEIAQYERARELMGKALGLQPWNRKWRVDYFEKLMSWQCYEEAHRIALIGASYFPEDPRFRRFVELSIDTSIRQEKR